MAETVTKTGISRDKGYLYFLRGSDIYKVPMKRAGGPPVAGKEEKVYTGNFKREDGYLYFITKEGNVARAKRAVGGQKRKKAAPAKKVAAKKAPAKKAAAKKAPAKKAAAKKAPAKKKR